MLKKQNGVTLVALVITIIVLLILAGVTLAMVMGDSGIFTKANSAAKETRISSARDAVRLAVLEVTTDQYSDTGSLSNPVADEAAAITEINKKLQDGYQIDPTSKAIKQNGKEVIGSNDSAAITVSIDVGTNHSITATFSNDDTNDSSNT